MRVLTLIAALCSAGPAFGGTQNLVIWNFSNKTIACAKVVFDATTNDYATYDWYILQNGTKTPLGAADFWYCEQEGNPAVNWSGNAPFCVSSAQTYVSPIFHAVDPTACSEAGGVMANFFPAKDVAEDPEEIDG